MEINKKALNYPFDLILIKMLPIHTTENTRKTEREKNYKIQFTPFITMQKQQNLFNPIC